MSVLPLVSIIIPTYNRAHLIGETLDSVLAQTYTNWECIVVDDGSVDGTEELLHAYISKDSRFQYHKRPDTHLAGGNGARNYGFELSKGEYIQWFDSDDIMLPNGLDLKVKAFLKNEVDFVVSKSKFLNSKTLFYHYAYVAGDISFNSFAIGDVSWVTDDFMIIKRIANSISYNENLLAGQEYNYCCKMLLKTEKAYFIDEFLTLRRDSEDSIGSNRKADRTRYLQSRFTVYWLNYLEISRQVKHKEFNKFSLISCMSCYFRSNSPISLPKLFYSELQSAFGIKSFYFILAKWSKQLFGKYYYFYNKLKED